MIERKKYLEELINSKDNGFPKVLTGIRRCGKSYTLRNIYYDYLVDSGVPKDHILIIDLDEDKSSSLRNPLLLGEYVRDYCRENNKYYVFVDEIQRCYSLLNPTLTEGKYILAREGDTEVVSFVDVILGLSHEANIDLYVTGSNSKMLSSDIQTAFRDKATNISLMPLSFDEYYSYVGGSSTDAIYEYMQYGGMPLAVLKKEYDKKEYLKRLFETTYFKDIIEHHKLKRSESLDELCNVISAGTGELLNAKKISDTFFSVKHEKISTQMVDDYVNHFKDAFLLREAKRFDIKGRKEIGALKKYYFTDTGLRNARLDFAFDDEGQMLENVVYNELIYNKYTVNVGTFDTIEKDTKGKSIRKTNEVDFYARKGLRKYYIQVCNDISNAKTRQREIHPFFKLNDQIQKIIVVNRPIKESLDSNGFTVIGIADFLLRFIK